MPLATELDHRRGERLGEAGSVMRPLAAINTIENSTDRAGRGVKKWQYVRSGKGSRERKLCR